MKFTMRIVSAVAVVAAAIIVETSTTTTTTVDAFVPRQLLLQRQHHNRIKNNHHHHHHPILLYHEQPTFQYVSQRHRPMIGSSVRRFAALDDDDDEDDDDDDDDEIDRTEPLADGIDSVSWLPSVKDAKTSTTTTTTTTVAKLQSDEHPDAELIPLFPLGGIVYTPNSQHTLNIFEPRYREMYTDILMNGTKRFAVAMSHPTKSGTFAQMAVLFELEDLKEVSERTADQIKYICNHRVTGRVKLHRVLNPQDWESRTTYLRAEGTVIDDSGKSQPEENPSIESSSSPSASIVVQDIENPIEQKMLKDAFSDLVELQHELEEDVRFTRASVLTLAVKPGSKSDGLWQTIKLWQSFADQRLMSRQNELQQDFQEKLQAYLKKEKGLKGALPSAIGFQDLSAELQREVIDLQKRMAVELQPLVLESTLTMQKILECPGHTARLQLVRHFVEAETKRLSTKKAIQSMFAGTKSKSSSVVESRTMTTDKKSDDKSLPAVAPIEEQTPDATDEVSKSFFAEDDAFQ